MVRQHVVARLIGALPESNYVRCYEVSGDIPNYARARNYHALISGDRCSTGSRSLPQLGRAAFFA